jgi:hypothetical protein
MSRTLECKQNNNIIARLRGTLARSEIPAAALSESGIPNARSTKI